MRISDWSSDVCSSDLRLDHLFGPARLLERGDEADVDVAVRRHLAAAVAADRGHRDPLARRAIARGIEVMGGEVVGEADDLVDQASGRIGRETASRGMIEQAALDLGAPRSEEHKTELESIMHTSYA